MKNNDYNESYWSYGADEGPLETTLILPGANKYTVTPEIKERERNPYDYIGFSGEKLFGRDLIYKNTYTIIHNYDYDGKYIYTSSNEDAAVIDENGNLTAVGIGSAIITSVTEDGTLETHTSINVKYSIWQQFIRIFYSDLSGSDTKCPTGPGFAGRFFIRRILPAKMVRHNIDKSTKI